MRITKRQLRRIIREAEGSTKKYDDDSALKGDQSKLPDGLQKGIIDKTVEDREEYEEEEREEKNEGRIMKLTRHRLRRLIQEALGSEDTMIIDALQGTWEEVRIDVGIPNPTSEEMAEESLAMMQVYYPREADMLHGKSNTEIDEILLKAFGGATGDGYHS